MLARFIGLTLSFVVLYVNILQKVLQSLWILYINYNYYNNHYYYYYNRCGIVNRQLFDYKILA